MFLQYFNELGSEVDCHRKYQGIFAHRFTWCRNSQRCCPNPKLVGRAADTLAEWLESEAIEDGYVSRHIDRWENVSDKAISPAGVNHMTKRRLDIAGYDESDYSAHGLRAGYLTRPPKMASRCPRPCGNHSIARCNRLPITTTTQRRS